MVTVTKRLNGARCGQVHPPADLRLAREATGRFLLQQVKERPRPLRPDAKSEKNELENVPRGDKSFLCVYDTTHKATVTASFFTHLTSRPAQLSYATALSPWKSAVASRASLRSAGG